MHKTYYYKGRPNITAKLKYRGKSKYFSFLIDSGSDYTLISRGDALHFDLEYHEVDSSEIRLEVANLTYMHVKKVMVDLVIGTSEHEIPILIAKEPVERLLGRRGLFSKFDITFVERNEEVIFRKV